MSNIIHIADILIPEDRQRKLIKIEDLEELADSIASQGLLHPIAVKALEDGKYRLVSGERRLNAVKLLHNQKRTFMHEQFVVNPMCIAATFVRHNADEYDLIEIELHENIKRVDISWQERIEAERKLHNLRTAKNPQHTIKDTARELLDEGTSENTVSVTATNLKRDLALAEEMEKDPEAFAKAKTKKDALKVLAQKTSNNIFAELGAIGAPSGEESPHEVYNCDAIEWLYSCKEETFDCILVDPPYGIDADSFGEQSSTGHNYRDTGDNFVNLMEEFIPLSYKVASDQAHMYMFCDVRKLAYLTEKLNAVGWKVWHAPLIWVKNNGMLPSPEYAPRRTYEMILFCNKNQLPVTGVYNDTLIHDKVAHPRHGAEKPVSLYVDLLKRSCREGYKVLDAFAGSGTILSAANTLKLKAVAVERDADNFNLCLARTTENIRGL